MDASDEGTFCSSKMTSYLAELYPFVNEKFTPLPKSWNPKDKYQHLWLSNCNRSILYKGHGKTFNDAGCIRATNYIPISCGIYYFEIKIIDKGRHGCIGIGYSARQSSINCLPGWEHYSYGYHGDDGYKFHSSGSGIPYGPKFTVNDIIGAGLNFVDKCCFFTKNGIYLGIAFHNIIKNLYPTVGMKTKDEQIEANFGQEPFLFNLEFITKDIRKRIKSNIVNFPPVNLYDASKSVNRNILEYLLHHCYIKTAIIFAKKTGQTIMEDLNLIKNRQHIMNLIRNGKLKEAIMLTDKLYPDLFKNNPDIYLRLLCREFIELFCNKDELTSHNTEATQEACSDINNIQFDQNNEHVNDIAMNYNLFKEMLCLGKKIFNLNQQLKDKNKYDCKNIIENVAETFSIICYNDPYNSTCNWLLDVKLREPILNELNVAILKYQNKLSGNIFDITPDSAGKLLTFMAQSAAIPSAIYLNPDDFLISK